MPTFEHGATQIYYEEAGNGPPLLCIPGGGLNATIDNFTDGAPFNPMAEFQDTYHCITMDLRNAVNGRSEGPLEIDRPWDAYSDDHLALMDHLGIEKFMILGFCIGGPFCWNLIRRAPDRIAAAVMVQPSGFRPERPNLFYENNINGWAPDIIAKRDDISLDMAAEFLTHMYSDRADFVFTVDRDFARNCQTPILILPDDIPAHPYRVAMEAANLAPNAQASLYPWKGPVEHIPLAIRHIATFLKANATELAED